MDATGVKRKKPYVQPQVADLGSVAELTLVVDKEFGSSDGFTLQGVDIRNAS